MKKTTLCLLLCVLAACSHKPMTIYPLAPFKDSYRLDGMSIMHEYYVVENYNGDTGVLQQFLGKFIDSAVGDRPQKYDQFYLSIYKSSRRTNKNTPNTDHLEPEFDYHDDLIASCYWWHTATDHELMTPTWHFYEDGEFIDPQPSTNKSAESIVTPAY